MASDIEVCVKQRGSIEFLHAEKKEKEKKIASINIHVSLLNVYGHQPADTRAVRGVHISRGSSGPPALVVQIAAGAAYRLLLSTGENA